MRYAWLLIPATLVGCKALEALVSGAAGAAPPPEGSGVVDVLAHAVGSVAGDFIPMFQGAASLILSQGILTARGRQNLAVAFTRRGGWAGTLAALRALVFGTHTPKVS